MTGLANSPKSMSGQIFEIMSIRVPLLNINCSVTPMPSFKQITELGIPLGVGPTEGLLPFNDRMVVLFSPPGEGKVSMPRSLATKRFMHAQATSSDDPPQAKASVWACKCSNPRPRCTHRPTCGGRELFSTMAASRMGLKMG